MYTVSIIICTYNRCKLLDETLVSVLSLIEYNQAYELLVIDNNSNDDTEATVAKYPSVKYFKEYSQGLSFARNRGVKEAGNEILVFLDDDVDLEFKYFDVIQELYSDSEVDVLGGKVLPYRIEVPKWLPLKFYYLASIFDLGENVTVADKLMGANYSLRRAAALNIGEYDVNLGRKGDVLSGGEEIDYLNRAKRLGFKVFYSPRLVVYHKINDKLNHEYILTFSYQHGKSEVIVDKKQSKLKFFLKIFKGGLVIALAEFKNLLRDNMSSKISSAYFKGYLESALYKNS